MGSVPGADSQTILQDPRFEDAAFCRASATVSNTCALASAAPVGADL